MNSISAYKISTITATGSVNTGVNLDVLFDHICIKEDNVLYAEYGSQKKGISKKSAVTKRKVVETTKKFDNQLTLECRFRMEEGNFTVLNCKIFRNGNIQMTGVKYIEQGHEFVDRIIDIIREAPDSVAIKEELQNTNYSIRMINCDYRVGFSIKRDALYRVMINEYDNMASFEPCIYPGVKIQYMWNMHKSDKDGVCGCQETCVNGKGDGKSEGKCKKITVAVFQSGCIIITGAQNKLQIDETYRWINEIIMTHRDKIEKKSIVMPQHQQEEKKKILISRSKIVSLRPAASHLF